MSIIIRTNSKKCLSESQRQDIAVFLLERLEGGQLLHGSVNEAASKWGVNRSTIGEIWRRAKRSLLADGSLKVQNKRFGNQNKKRIIPNIEFIKSLKFSERSSIEKLSKRTNVSVGTIHKWVVNGTLKPHSSPLHPQLTDLNKVSRIKFCLNALKVLQTVAEQQAAPTIMFKNMSNTIHIDEKWFYLSRINQRYYLVDGEEAPYRSCNSKRYLPKVMFLCAVSRPVYADDGQLIFDGKIGIFPFTMLQPAQRASKNRAAGTMETKSIESVTKQVTKDWFIQKLIPAIKSKWPPTWDKHIFIQQDNAKPHFSNNDPDFREAATSDGFNIELVFQPPNSPDLNANDLGFFRAIQSLQSEISASNVDELVEAVQKAFSDYCPWKLNKIFLTLQSVMVEILKANGHNNFSIPHMKKDHLQAQGILPTDLTVEEGLVKSCIDVLLENGLTGGLEKIMEELGYLPNLEELNL